MDCYFERDLANDMMTVTSKGTPSLQGFIELSANGACKYREKPFLRYLMDNRDLIDGYTLSHDELTEYARDQVNYKSELEAMHIAIVVPSALVFGLTRVWESIVNSNNVEPSLNITDDIDQARKWLLAQGPR